MRVGFFAAAIAAMLAPWSGCGRRVPMHTEAPEPHWRAVEGRAGALYTRTTLLADGSVLISGGEQNNQRIRDTARFYPEQNAVIAEEPMAIGRARHTATLLGDGRVLVSGGEGPSLSAATAELFDPSLPKGQRWRSIADSHGARHAVAVLLPDGAVFRAYGNQDSTVPIPFTRFDPATESWYDLYQPLPSGSVGGAKAYTTTDGDVWVLGGAPSIYSKNPIHRIEQLDGRTGSPRDAGRCCVGGHGASGQREPVQPRSSW
jgi:hypothetical protein